MIITSDISGTYVCVTKLFSRVLVMIYRNTLVVRLLCSTGTAKNIPSLPSAAARSGNVGYI